MITRCGGASRLGKIICIASVTFLFASLTVALPDLKNKKSSLNSIRTTTTDLAKKKIQKTLRSKTTRKSNGRGKKSSPSSALEDSSSPSSTSSFSDVVVESFLLPRRIRIRFLLRCVCLVLIGWSLILCLQTSGVPYVRTIWQVLYQDASMPSGYNPLPKDVILASLIADAAGGNRLMFPPEHLPSAGPILGLIASITVNLGLTVLLPFWSTRFRVLLDYYRTDNLPTTMLKQMPSVLVRVNQESISNLHQFLIRPLHRVPSSSTQSTTPSSSRRDDESIEGDYIHPTEYYFEVDNCRAYCDPKTRICMDGAPTLHRAQLSSLQRLVQEGGLSSKQRMIAQERYEPYNHFSLASPTIQDAFFTRLSSPLVVIQFLGRIMSLLEDGTGALYSMIFSLVEHYMNAKQAIVSAAQMAQEVKSNLQDTSGYHVSVWREDLKQWQSKEAGELVPGDMFRLKIDENSSKIKNKELIVPVDALVLKGQCLTNEAILTGESVPQVKIPIDFDCNEGDYGESNESRSRELDLQKDRASILFAGTTLIHTTDESEDGIKSVGVTCIALRTGTYSSKGKLLKALKGNAHVGSISNPESEKDAIRLIASLSICAAISCASLFVKRDNNARPVSPFRRIIQCSRIILASIPSDLPTALSSIARSCSRVLRDMADVVCSEPGSLLTAAYIDTVVFDKTGTLTADTQSLSKLVPPKPSFYLSESFQRVVLAGCHSLVQFCDNDSGKISIVGDPLDKAALQFSGWNFNHTAGYYFLTTNLENDDDSGPIRLWQIRSYPFDPSRRMSSAIVLLQLKDSSFELWRLTKGSPDSMKTLLRRDSSSFESYYSNTTEELEMEGFRSIAMGAENLSEAHMCEILFPGGLSNDPRSLGYAKEKGNSIHRNEIEKCSSDQVSNLIFCGFCCFDAAIRPSSRRIVKELSRGGILSIMLTGDSVDAALGVGRRVGVVSNRKIAVLDFSKTSSDEEERLVWKILQTRLQDDGSFRILRQRTKTEEFTLSSVQKFLRLYKNGELSLAVHGRGLEMILNDQFSSVGSLIIRNLDALSLIARATPELKKRVIDTLKYKCEKKVMMCGDGVNDVAAIQSADVAAALLNGFGSEEAGNSSVDFDDERRMKQLKRTKIGSNRVLSVDRPKGGSEEAWDRILEKIATARNEIDHRVSSSAESEEQIHSKVKQQYTFNDVKEMIAASMDAVREERIRTAKLRQGGGDAARILAAERKKLEPNDLIEESLTESTIKPGEASLVSSFSCLHPSVDGVDTILREGIATAASVLASKQTIALHSLMSCFHLATLYRDGFRYGMIMSQIELFSYILLESARFKASCTPRPRLPVNHGSVTVRPPSSLFHPSSFFSTVAQAIIHLSFMSLSVNYARRLERAQLPVKPGRFKIGMVSSHGGLLGKLVDILSNTAKPENNGNGAKRTRDALTKRFQPNYETNCVFIFSILQGALIVLVNHRGRPFCRAALESRDLCKMFALKVLFFMICVTGSMPPITNLIGLKPFPSWRSKLTIMCIAAANVAGCALCRWITDHFLEIEIDDEENFESDEILVAADLERKLLREEAAANARGFKVFCISLLYFLLDILSDATKTSEN